LGILFNNKLSFNAHVEKVCNEAYKLLGFVIRNTREFRNFNALIIVFNTFVRSKLEYASIIWTPYYKQFINKIERIQNKFLRYLYYKIFRINSYQERVSYNTLLKIFGISSLATRHELLQLTFLYKLVNGIIDSSECLKLLNFNTKAVNLRSRLLFNCNRSKTIAHSNSPVTRMCQLFNKLAPNNVDVDFAMPYSTYVKTLKYNPRLL